MTAFVIPSDKDALTPDEAERATVIRIAHYYGVAPAEVRTWAYADILDTLEVMEADNQIEEIKMQRASRGR